MDLLHVKWIQIHCVPYGCFLYSRLNGNVPSLSQEGKMSAVAKLEGGCPRGKCPGGKCPTLVRLSYLPRWTCEHWFCFDLDTLGYVDVSKMTSKWPKGRCVRCEKHARDKMTRCCWWVWSHSSNVDDVAGVTHFWQKLPATSSTKITARRLDVTVQCIR